MCWALLLWTVENRGRYDRSKLRHPSDLTDAEWALVEPLVPSAKRGGNKRTVDVREVVNGLMYVLGTGCQWDAIPKDLPPRSTVHGYPLELGRHLGAHPPCALPAMPRTGRARGQPNVLHH
jgi:hypothetical protein